MKKISIIALAVMFLAACSKENMDVTPGTSAKNGSASNSPTAKSARPFSANIFAAADTDPSIPPTSCSGDIPGFATPDFLLSGTATHTGLFKVQSRLHHESCDLNTTTRLLTTNVSGQIVAANGDVINYSGNDVVNVINLLTQTGTTGAITGTWTITGGTGRFAGATGSLTVNGTVDFVTTSFSCTCQGTITY